MLFSLLMALLALAAPEPLRVQLAAEPSSLDPFHVSDVLGFNITANVQEGLVRLDGHGRLQNALAERYEISPDGLTYRFHLRRGRWSDGEPIKAADFLLGLKVATDPATAARDASLLSALQETKEEKGQLVLRLREPDASFLQALTMPLAAPLPSHAWRGKWSTSLPVTGPYLISHAKNDREIRLSPNPHHPAQGQRPITFVVVPEDTTALNLLDTGGLHVLTTVPATEYTRLEKNHRLSLWPGAATFYLSGNLKRAPFSQLAWRRALAGAVHRENLARLQPHSLKATASYLPSALGFEALPALPAQAPIQGEPVSLVFASSSLSLLVAQRLQNDLAAKGFTLRLEPMEWKGFLARLQSDTPALFYMGYSAPFADPVSHLKVYGVGEADNRAQFQSEKYAQLLAKVKATRGPARRALVNEAHRELVQKEAVVIPLLERVQAFGLAPGVKNFRVNPYGVMDLREIR